MRRSRMTHGKPLQQQRRETKYDLEVPWQRDVTHRGSHTAHRLAGEPQQKEISMKNTKKFALIGALAAACALPAFAQNAGGAAGGGQSNGTNAAADSTNMASGAMTKPSSKGTTLHQQNKAHKQKGASAAAAASALGTNDKGQPQ
jgi:hypothetical protein